MWERLVLCFLIVLSTRLFYLFICTVFFCFFFVEFTFETEKDPFKEVVMLINTTSTTIAATERSVSESVEDYTTVITSESGFVEDTTAMETCVSEHVEDDTEDDTSMITSESGFVENSVRDTITEVQKFIMNFHYETEIFDWENFEKDLSKIEEIDFSG